MEAWPFRRYRQSEAHSENPQERKKKLSFGGFERTGHARLSLAFVSCSVSNAGLRRDTLGVSATHLGPRSAMLDPS